MNDAGLYFFVSSSLVCDVNKDAAASAFVIEVVNNIRLDLKTCRLELEDFKTKKNPLTKLPTLRFLRKFYAFTQPLRKEFVSRMPRDLYTLKVFVFSEVRFWLAVNVRIEAQKQKTCLFPAIRVAHCKYM